MDLARGQAALARLTADGALRRRFLTDPASAAEALSLTAEEAASLAETAGEGIRRFAVSLERKRRGGIAFHLPLTRRALSEAWAAVVARYVDVVPGAPTYRDDAAAFARWLASPGEDDGAIPPWLHDLATFETVRGHFVDPRKRVAVRRFRHPVPRIAAALAAGRPVDDTRPRTTLVVWWRVRSDGPLRTRWFSR